MPQVYDATPYPVADACEQLLRAYVDDATLSCDPALLHDATAAPFAEAVALQALELLAADRGSTADLLFAPLWDTSVFAELAPVLPPLLRYLRARLAGQEPVLRLNPGSPSPAYPLLLLAAQALRAAQDDVPDAVRRCLAALATDPAAARVPAGDLANGLPDGADVENAVYFRDELRKALTQTVPVRDVLAAQDGTVLLVLDLAARPDVADLFRILLVDPPPGGADTGAEFGVFAGTDGALLRLDVQWFDPVRADVAVVLDVDQHAAAVQRLAAPTSTVLGLTGVDPREYPDALVPYIPVPGDPDRVRQLLEEAAARRSQ